MNIKAICLRDLINTKMKLGSGEIFMQSGIENRQTGFLVVLCEKRGFQRGNEEQPVGLSVFLVGWDVIRIFQI